MHKDEDPDYGAPTEDADSYAFSKSAASAGRDQLAEEHVQSVGVGVDDSAEPDLSRLNGRRFGIPDSAVESADTVSGAVESGSEYPPVIEEETAPHPWAAPLQSWDFSHSEWPVLVGSTEEKASSWSKYGIAVVVLLAFAAGYYFLVYSLASPPPRKAVDTATTALVPAIETGPPASWSPESDALAQGASARPEARADAASQPAQPAAHETVTPEENSAKGRFSLQAAAFPAEGGAGELAEKLKQAGLPSYVVPADIARRGRWFRVRVGRFNSAEDAQRFVGEAQQRARAAGLTVQLIVCQYDQP